MDVTSLQILVNKIRDADGAWSTASEQGSKHVLTLSNAIITLSDAAIHTFSNPAVHSTTSLHTQAQDSSKWLQLCLVRLSKILRSVQECAQSLEAVVDKSVVPIWSLPLSHWYQLIARFASSLQHDLNIKQSIMSNLQRLADDAPVHRDKVQCDVVYWLEQPSVLKSTAMLIVATFEAELDAREAQQSLHLSTPIAYPASPSPNRQHKKSSSDANISPALAFLKQSGRKKR